MVEQELNEIRKIIDKINNEHKNKLENVNEPIFLTVFLSDDSKIIVEITKNGIKTIDQHRHKEIEFKNHISISYKQLKKTLENKTNIIRYIMSGKIKVKGNLKYILNVISEL